MLPPEKLRQLCGRLAQYYGGSALGWARLPLGELRQWNDAALKEQKAAKMR